jgi:hypothetical protein
MRTLTLVSVLAFAAGCSDGHTFQQGGTEVSSAPAEQVGKTEQASQFADNAVLNLVDPGVATISVTADGFDVDVNVYYVGDKELSNGTHQAAAPKLITTLHVPTDQTVLHVVNLLDPAFAGGYGAIMLDSNGVPQDVFQTYLQYTDSMFSVGGSVFQGGAYRIPYFSGTTKVVLALTSQSGFPFNVTLTNVAHPTDQKVVTLDPLSTYRFDTSQLGWNIGSTSSIDIVTNNSGTVAVGGYMDRVLLGRTRIAPVTAAPFN